MAVVGHHRDAPIGRHCDLVRASAAGQFAGAAAVVEGQAPGGVVGLVAEEEDVAGGDGVGREREEDGGKEGGWLAHGRGARSGGRIRPVVAKVSWRVGWAAGGWRWWRRGWCGAVEGSVRRGYSSLSPVATLPESGDG